MKAFALAMLIAFGFSAPVLAVPVVEGEPDGAAGLNDTLGTATDLTGLGGVIDVAGTIRDTGSSLDDIDFYKVALGVGTLTLSVSGPTTGIVSSNGGTTDVALFDAAGLLIAYDNNNPNAGPSDPAVIDPFNIVTAGIYYVAISEWSEQPNALTGAPVYTPLANDGYAVSGVGVDATYADTGGNQHPGERYTLSITGAAVPEPATVLLLGLGLAGLGTVRRRLHQSHA